MMSFNTGRSATARKAAPCCRVARVHIRVSVDSSTRLRPVLGSLHFLLFTLFLITFTPRAVDIVKCPWSSFFYLRHFNIDYFTLHYIHYGPQTPVRFRTRTRNHDAFSAIAEPLDTSALVLATESFVLDLEFDLDADNDLNLYLDPRAS